MLYYCYGNHLRQRNDGNLQNNDWAFYHIVTVTATATECGINPSNCKGWRKKLETVTSHLKQRFSCMFFGARFYILLSISRNIKPKLPPEGEDFMGRKREWEEILDDLSTECIRVVRFFALQDLENFRVAIVVRNDLKFQGKTVYHLELRGVHDKDKLISKLEKNSSLIYSVKLMTTCISYSIMPRSQRGE